MRDNDEALLIGVAVARRALLMLSQAESRELSLLEVIALATKDVLTIIDNSDDPLSSLDEVEKLERSLG